MLCEEEKKKEHWRAGHFFSGRRNEKQTTCVYFFIKWGPGYEENWVTISFERAFSTLIILQKVGSQIPSGIQVFEYSEHTTKLIMSSLLVNEQ